MGEIVQIRETLESLIAKFNKYESARYTLEGRGIAKAISSSDWLDLNRYDSGLIESLKIKNPLNYVRGMRDESTGLYYLRLKDDEVQIIDKVTETEQDKDNFGQTVNEFVTAYNNLIDSLAGESSKIQGKVIALKNYVTGISHVTTHGYYGKMASIITSTDIVNSDNTRKSVSSIKRDSIHPVIFNNKEPLTANDVNQEIEEFLTFVRGIPPFIMDGNRHDEGAYLIDLNGVGEDGNKKYIIFNKPDSNFIVTDVEEEQLNSYLYIPCVKYNGRYITLMELLEKNNDNLRVYGDLFDDYYKALKAIFDRLSAAEAELNKQNEAYKLAVAKLKKLINGEIDPNMAGKLSDIESVNPITKLIEEVGKKISNSNYVNTTNVTDATITSLDSTNTLTTGKLVEYRNELSSTVNSITDALPDDIKDSGEIIELKKFAKGLLSNLDSLLSAIDAKNKEVKARNDADAQDIETIKNWLNETFDNDAGTDNLIARLTKLKQEDNELFNEIINRPDDFVYNNKIVDGYPNREAFASANLNTLKSGKKESIENILKPRLKSLNTELDSIKGELEGILNSINDTEDDDKYYEKYKVDQAKRSDINTKVDSYNSKLAEFNKLHEALGEVEGVTNHESLNEIVAKIDGTVRLFEINEAIEDKLNSNRLSDSFKINESNKDILGSTLDMVNNYLKNTQAEEPVGELRTEINELVNEYKGLVTRDNLKDDRSTESLLDPNIKKNNQDKASIEARLSQFGAVDDLLKHPYDMLHEFLKDDNTGFLDNISNMTEFNNAKSNLSSNINKYNTNLDKALEPFESAENLHNIDESYNVDALGHIEIDNELLSKIEEIATTKFEHDTLVSKTDYANDTDVKVEESKNTLKGKISALKDKYTEGELSTLVSSIFSDDIVSNIDALVDNNINGYIKGNSEHTLVSILDSNFKPSNNLLKGYSKGEDQEEAVYIKSQPDATLETWKGAIDGVKAKFNMGTDFSSINEDNIFDRYNNFYRKSGDDQQPKVEYNKLASLLDVINTELGNRAKLTKFRQHFATGNEIRNLTANSIYDRYLNDDKSNFKNDVTIDTLRTALSDYNNAIKAYNDRLHTIINNDFGGDESKIRELDNSIPESDSKDLPTETKSKKALTNLIKLYEAKELFDNSYKSIADHIGGTDDNSPIHSTESDSDVHHTDFRDIVKIQNAVNAIKSKAGATKSELASIPGAVVENLLGEGAINSKKTDLNASIDRYIKGDSPIGVEEIINGQVNPTNPIIDDEAINNMWEKAKETDSNASYVDSVKEYMKGKDDTILEAWKTHIKELDANIINSNNHNIFTRYNKLYRPVFTHAKPEYEWVGQPNEAIDTLKENTLLIINEVLAGRKKDKIQAKKAEIDDFAESRPELIYKFLQPKVLSRRSGEDESYPYESNIVSGVVVGEESPFVTVRDDNQVEVYKHVKDFNAKMNRLIDDYIALGGTEIDNDNRGSYLFDDVTYITNAEELYNIDNELKTISDDPDVVDPTVAKRRRDLEELQGRLTSVSDDNLRNISPTRVRREEEDTDGDGAGTGESPAVTTEPAHEESGKPETQADKAPDYDKNKTIGQNYKIQIQYRLNQKKKRLDVRDEEVPTSTVGSGNPLMQPTDVSHTTMPSSSSPAEDTHEDTDEESSEE